MQSIDIIEIHILYINIITHHLVTMMTMMLLSTTDCEFNWREATMKHTNTLM